MIAQGSETSDTPGMLSLQANKVRENSSGENLLWEVCADLWDPETNPNGYVSLGIAENSLMHEDLRQFLASKPLIDEKSKALTYGDGPSGSTSLKASLAQFLNEYFCPAKAVEPAHLMITNGVTAAIEHIAWAIANPGDGVLVGRPYYRAFEMDMGHRSRVQLVPIAFGNVDPCGRDCVAKYEEALLTSNENGVRIRALLLCHPHNPLGRCYSKDTLLGFMRLCQKYRIHLISDEIYALSVWKNTIDKFDNSAEFESVLSIDTTDIISPELVHVLWGTSKDFGANGLRLGTIISQHNPELLAACKSCAPFSFPSSLAENAVNYILSDRSFLQYYVKTNSERLSTAYAHAAKKLNDCGIEYQTGANATFFLWVNLGKFWTRNEKNWGGDSTTILKALLRSKVFIMDGKDAGAEESGWFRIVFSQRSELVDETIKRIEEVATA